MAGGRTLRIFGGDHRLRIDEEDILVFCDDFYSDSFVQLVWFGARRGFGWLGTSGCERSFASHRAADIPRRECRPEHDIRNVDDFLRPVDGLGVSSEWSGRVHF